MTLVPEPIEHWIPTEEAERKAVLLQLDAILSSSHFRASKRYPSFLRFVVELTLDGCGEELKERTIGVGVFERELTYDTNADPIVRVTAGEVRKRLTQYYSEPTHHSELKIQLSTGSYIAHFEKPPASVISKVEFPPVQESTDVQIDSVTNGMKQNYQQKKKAKRNILLSPWLRMAGFSLVVVGIALFWGRAWSRKVLPRPVGALTEFWQPFLAQRGSVLTCVSPLPMLHNTRSPSEPTPDMSLLDAVERYNIVPLPDAITLSKISSYLGENHVKLRIKNSEATSFDDVQAGPTILIGGFHNQWTMRLTSKLRFYFEDSPDISRIIDRQAKVQPEWLIYRSKAYSSLVQDYAIIARYQDSTTGNIVVIVAGIGPNGTLAAGDFLTHGEYLRKLFEQAPKGWTHNNVEAVIATQVIDGKSGPPRVVASQFW